MKQTQLTPAEVLAGYDAVSQLYPHVPPIAAWRAWEWAAYRHFELPAPVLDVGCGDGAYFRLVWPHLRGVTGVELNPTVAAQAQQSGVYQALHICAAHQLPAAAGEFAAVFANCSLEHMEQLPAVLQAVSARLRPGGVLLASVVTDKLPVWTTVPWLLDTLGQPAEAVRQQAGYLAYHHYVNALPPAKWVAQFASAGLEVVEHIPIAPEVFSRLFLLLDHLWHTPAGHGELGDQLHRWAVGRPDFPAAFRQVLTAVLQLEQNWDIGSGAVFWARKP